jgi:hypothetical protein
MTIGKKTTFFQFYVNNFFGWTFCSFIDGLDSELNSALKIPLLNVFKKCFASLAFFGSFGVKGVQNGSEKKGHVWTEVKHGIASPPALHDLGMTNGMRLVLFLSDPLMILCWYQREDEEELDVTVYGYFSSSG